MIKEEEPGTYRDRTKLPDSWPNRLFLQVLSIKFTEYCRTNTNPPKSLKMSCNIQILNHSSSCVGWDLTCNRKAQVEYNWGNLLRSWKFKCKTSSSNIIENFSQSIQKIVDVKHGLILRDALITWQFQRINSWTLGKHPNRKHNINPSLTDIESDVSSYNKINGIKSEALITEE